MIAKDNRNRQSNRCLYPNPKVVYTQFAMQIVRDTLELQELKAMAQRTFGDLVKAVVDVEKEIIAVDGSLHADEEALLLGEGSRQENLWGVNLYPESWGEEGFVEFDSMINVRPAQGNLGRGLKDPELKKKIRVIVSKLIKS